MKHFLLATVFGLTALAASGARAQTLTYGVAAPITSMDPHYHNLSPNIALAQHLFSSLTDTDAKARVIPSLALSWKLVDDKTWEFKLRPGVKFSNGVPFMPEDIAFTLARVPTVPNSPSSYSIYTRAVTGVEVIDPTTVRLRTDTVYPLLPVDLAQVMMLSKKIHEGAATEDFNSGKVAIGTGPYRLLSYRPGDRVEMERSETYWGRKPAWQHVTARILTNDSSRTAALLAGDVQVIDAVNTSDLPRMRRDPNVTLAETVGLRIIYLALDQSKPDSTPRVTGPNGEKLDKNPLRDRRVREALSLAINRPAIVSQVMEDAAVASGQFLPQGSFGYVPGLDAPKHDPARAKALLAEAGFPNGLRIVLNGPNDRYVNDGKIIQAIGQMWTRAGIPTEVEPLTWTTFIGRAGKQEFSAFLVGWGSASGEASNPLRSLVATWDPKKGMGVANRGRYSNPAMDQVLFQALATADDPKREKLLQEATSMAMLDVGIIPLHIQKNIWGLRRGYTMTPRVDEATLAMDIEPAK